MLIICQYELKRMPAGRQRYGLLRLSSSEMEMVGIVRNWSVEGRRVGIDDKVVVPCCP